MAGQPLRAEGNERAVQSVIEVWDHHGLLLYCIHLKYVMKLKFYIFYFAGQTQMIHYWSLPWHKIKARPVVTL